MSMTPHFGQIGPISWSAPLLIRSKSAREDCKRQQQPWVNRWGAAQARTLNTIAGTLYEEISADSAFNIKAIHLRMAW